MEPGRNALLQRIAAPGLKLFFASVLLGVAYNAASPLGVRGTGTGDQPATIPSSTSPSLSQTAYANETVSITLQGPAATAPTPVYQNQAIGMALAPVPSPPHAHAHGTPAPKPTLSSLTWPEVKTLQSSSQAVLVDARLEPHYKAGHIPGAVSLPSNSSPEVISGFGTKHSKSTPLVVYCGSASCPMAHHLAEVLINQHGFSNVKVMPGGFAEYRLAEASAGSGR